MPGGGLDVAFAALLPAAKFIPREPVVFFNLACYACQMGRVDEAWEWLRQAVKIGDRARILEMARHESDLEPLKQRFGEL
jgi:hypothetical protein